MTTTAQTPKRVRPRVKLAAVERVLSGESIARVAAKESLSEELLTKWHKAYTSAGKNALRYNNDPGELPTIKDLRLTAQKAFPGRLLHECRSAASFFCAAFYGKNDLIHVYNAGVPNVTMLDQDAEKLEHMRSIYPDHWETVCGDAFEIVKQLHADGKKYDAVVADMFTGEPGKKVAWDFYDHFSGITGKYLFLMYFQGMLDELGVPAEPAPLQEALIGKLGRPVNVVDLVRRSSHAGGMFWCVIRTDV
jgi:hypothetical protein